MVVTFPELLRFSLGCGGALLLRAGVLVVGITALLLGKRSFRSTAFLRLAGDLLIQLWCENRVLFLEMLVAVNFFSL